LHCIEIGRAIHAWSWRGSSNMILGNEIESLERGDLIHIPRFTPHRSRAVGGTAVFFTVSIPGSGDLNQDYTRPGSERPRRSIRDGEGTPLASGASLKIVLL